MPAVTAVEPFVLLDENRFAAAAVQRLQRRGADRGPAAAGGRLVHIDGPAGAGKSHLVRQFVRDARRADRTLRTALVTASQFAAELAEASAEKTIDRFQAKYRALDLFICEDLAALENRPETQRQLVAVLDEIMSHGGRVVLTSRKSPGELTGVSARLVSRCHGGTCATIRPPGHASRIRLLEHFSQARQLPLPPDAVALLARELPVSPRELLAAVVQLDALARFEKSPPDLRLARRYLAGEVKPPAATLRQIGEAVARHFGLSAAALRGASRQPGVVLARQCAMFLARALTTKTLAEIARHFGRRNHTTVLHACRRIDTQLVDDPALRQHLAHIRGTLGAPEGTSRA